MNSPRFMSAILLAHLTVGGLSLAQTLPPPPEMSGATGTQIAWASDAFATNLMADGVTPFEASGKTIRFEIGTFMTGFDPSTEPFENWADKWVVLQGTDYDLNDQQFIGTATLFSNSDPFSIGAQAYIWGYLDKDLSQGETEWILMSSPAWSIPAANSPLPTTFSVSDVRVQDVLVGSVGGPGGSYYMQLGTVPEPSTCLLGMISLLSLALHRKRA
jgi:hypothetical protein